MASTRGKAPSGRKGAQTPASTSGSAARKGARQSQSERANEPTDPVAAKVRGQPAIANATKRGFSAVALKTVLGNLATALTGVVQNNQPSVPLPARFVGTLEQPDGSQASSLQIEVLPPAGAAAAASQPDGFGVDTSGSQVVATGLTDSAGDFSIPLPGGVTLPPGASLSLRVRGSDPSGVAPISVQPSLIGPTGYLGTMTLPQRIPPIPPSIYQQLQQELAGGDGATGSSAGAPPAVPKLTLGDDADCIRVLENQISFEQFPYGIFFQLYAPGLFGETEQPNPDVASVYQQFTRTEKRFKRVPVTAPISVDDFRAGLLTGPTLVGTLGLGYVLRCSQAWQFQGLALGDLVYSLPLAPGEQQQIVVEEQTTTLVVREQEQVFGAESSQASSLSDSSAQATFQSAFNQSAQGGSNYSTASESAGLSAGGGLLGLLGGPSGSVGESVSGGSSNNWFDGLQNYASTASQSVQNYAEQQSSAQRRAQRTAVRMASSSESTSVTTKTITNHNKLHALTMQYFEVLRLFDVSTSFDAVSLVCLVPLDIVWFLPPGQPGHLDDVITDSDLSNAIQYATQLNSALSNLSQVLQVAIAQGSIPILDLFVQGIVESANQQLGAAVAEATSLNGILSGLGSNYQTQASEAGQLLSAVTQARTNVAQSLGSSPVSVADLQSAQQLVTSGIAVATALYQQLSSPSMNGAMTRKEVLDRYQGLLAHSDVLKRWLPSSYASGLTRLERFAADPRASLALDSLAEDVIQFSASASVLPFDHVYVAVVTRWGTRIGPVEMIPNPPTSVPGQFDPAKAFKTSDDLLQYLQGQRNPGNSSASQLQAAVALPRSLSPSDVVGFEITHGMDSFTYQLASPLDQATSLFGAAGSAWPAGILGIVGDLIAPPVTPAATTWTAAQLASRVGAPYLWNFQANLTASVQGNPDSYVKPDPSFVELPAGTYPVPAIEVAPLLKYSDLIAIESTLQHVLRNLVRYSKAVWTWLTPEERVMLLEPYVVTWPGLETDVPLLDCVGNVVLGFQGSSMIMPFSIPPRLAAEGGKTFPMTTGQFEDGLLQFHRQTAPHQVTRTMLPTRGVLGEAMLGHCASGEKIDLTRFWNWQDSPADSAPAITPVSAPTSQVSTLAAAQAPNQLGAMLPNLVNNVQASAPAAPNFLQTMIQAALAQKGIDPSSMTGASQLATLLQNAQNTGNAARADQLKASTELASQAMSTLGQIVGGQGGSGGSGGKSGSGSSDGSSGSSGSSAAGDAMSVLLPLIIAALA